MSIDVAAIRAQFPALEEGMAHFDGPGGSQTPRRVADAVARTMASAVANRGQGNPAERRADAIVVEARQAVADLTGGVPQGTIFGRSMTAITYDLSRAFAAEWGPGDEVVVTRLDHDANIRPWVQAAERVGATVRWVDLDPESGELPVESMAEAIGDRTRLVAFTGASNLIGTMPDVPAISELAHAAGAITYVDAVHLAPHAPIDRESLGADVLACSPYKFGGPHLGCASGDPELLERLRPDKLLPSSNAVPERFELGTLPYEMLAGVTAAVDVLADLVPMPAEEGIGRRQRVLNSLSALVAQEDGLRQQLETGLAGVEGLVLYSRALRRTPTVLFTVENVDSAALSDFLAERGVNAPASSFYAVEASQLLGLGDAGGIRAGIAPYTDEDDVQRLVDGVRDGVEALRS